MNIAYFGLKIIYIIALFTVARQRNSLVSVEHHIPRNVDLENYSNNRVACLRKSHIQD